MSALVRFSLLSSLLLLIVGGCASVATKSQTAETIKPSGAHEDCMELLRGQSLDYTFEASKPLNFNIHYHGDKDITYPVKKDGISKDSGTFTAKIKQYYCLMWTNPGAASVTLKYNYHVKDKLD